LPVTIRDVAKLAGCSIKTVSRVLNDEPYVTEETRAKVIAAVRAAGYAPNISAKRLAENKSYMICILMYPGFYQSASEMLLRVMDIGYEENYDILIQPYFPPHTRARKKLVNLIYEHRIDGIVTTPPLDADGFIEDMLNTYKVPHVRINPFERVADSPYVTGDDFQGAFDMTEYLIRLGHRKVSFYTGPGNMRSSAYRLRGYQDALRAHGIPFRADYVRSSEWTFDGGYTNTRLLFEAPDRPTAIFAGNDEAAYGVIFAAQEMGVDIPGQLSVCGFDDLALSKNIWPGLTTVHQPGEVLVELAARLLIDLLKGKPILEPAVIVPSRLVIRGSCASPFTWE
jgi:LacI family transcriptional regulator